MTPPVLPLVLAVDGGSQSTKVSVVGVDGTVHATGRAPLRPYDLGPGGRAVHPDDDLWTSLGVAARQALAGVDPGVDPGDIVAVGLCGIRFCRALLDEHDRLVEPVWSWMDDRVGRPHELAPGTTGLTSAGGYLAVRLTGVRRDSAASLQAPWPVDPTTRRWSTDPEAYRRAGMPREVLPELVDPGGLLGEVTPEAAAWTGIPAGLPVHATGNDKAVEALGCGLVDPGTLLLSLGTYVAAMTVGTVGTVGSVGELPTAPDDRCWVNDHVVPGRHLVESRGVRRGMWTVSWVRDLVAAAAPDRPEDADLLAWLEQGALDVPPGCGGLLALPDWLPPTDAPHRRGAFVGLDGTHGPHHLYRAVVEGLVLRMRTHVDDLLDTLGRSCDRVVVSGGGSRSVLMSQVVADVLGVPVERAAVADAAGLGAAICAAVGHGLHPDAATAVAAMTRPGVVVEPDADRVAAYSRLHRLAADVTDLMDPVLRRLAAG